MYYEDTFLREILEKCPFCYGQEFQNGGKKMNNTALRAEKEITNTIIFKNEKHKDFHQDIRLTVQLMTRQAVLFQRR